MESPNLTTLPYAIIFYELYAKGIFPMAESRQSPELLFIDPEYRGIIPLSDFRVPRRLRRTIRKDLFQIKFDCDFKAVIEACADREETWINDRIMATFLVLHEMGYAHSVEVWRDGHLAGGLYGLAIRGAFFGESMFSRQPGASKFALVYLADRLIKCGFRLLDTQFYSEHLSSFGAIEVSRKEFRRMLDEALQTESVFDSGYPASPGSEVLQRISHTS